MKHQSTIVKDKAKNSKFFPYSTENTTIVMSKGEGFMIRGPKIVDGILKRIKRVEDGTLFKQGTAGRSGGTGFTFNGGR